MVEFERVSREFDAPSVGTYRVLQDVSFSVARGAFVAIVGPSGCGKSTLLHVAAGLLPPTGGSVRVDGAPLTGINRRATYMFQQDALLPWKTVRENVALGLLLDRIPRQHAYARADVWLDRVGLNAFANHFPAQLSGGMRKRAAMAQNWILDREIVLMDEPFSALDVHTRHRMETELLALWDTTPGRASDAPAETQARKTILFVTHDLEEAIALADEVVVLAAGPESHVVAHHRIALERPRDVMEMRTTAAFVELYRSLWEVLRVQVIRTQGLERRA